MFAKSSLANKNKKDIESSHISNSAVKTQILRKKPNPIRSLSADAAMSTTALDPRQSILAQVVSLKSIFGSFFLSSFFATPGLTKEKL